MLAGALHPVKFFDLFDEAAESFCWDAGFVVKSHHLCLSPSLSLYVYDVCTYIYMSKGSTAIYHKESRKGNLSCSNVKACATPL